MEHVSFVAEKGVEPNMRHAILLVTVMGAALLLACGLALVSSLGPSGSSVASAQTPPPDERRTEENAGSQQANAETLSGTLHIVWGDPRPNSDLETKPGFVLDDGRGPSEELLLDDQVAKPLGGPLALNGERVVVEGTRVEEDHVRVESIRLASPEGPSASASEGPDPVTGSQPWVTIGCRFGDSTGVTPRPQSWFQTQMGGTEPGFDHFWRELSYNSMNLAGSQAVAWYNLPQPRSFYLSDPQTHFSGHTLNWDLIARDCTAAADADVFFPNFKGINMMFNQDLDCCAWGGGGTLTRDGQTKSYSMTWMPPWGYNNHSILAQEMGHGFGLPHSSGPYSQTYDSKWDPMSSGGTCSPAHATYGCLGDHTIAFHKDMQGWMPASRKYVAASNSDQTITLERLGMPATTSGYLMAQIPIAGSSTQFYTVEARRLAGYDSLGPIPGEAVVIHKVNTTLEDRNAQVVDPDNNGNANDAGAMWLPEETFTDSANGIAVQVTGSTTTGYTVRVQNGVQNGSQPTIVSSTPTPEKTGVLRKTNVTTSFSKEMNKTTLNKYNVTLYKSGNSTQLGATVTPSSDGMSVKLNPYGSTTKLLAARTWYQAVIWKDAEGVKDIEGNVLKGSGNYQESSGGSYVYWWFKTGLR